MIWPIFMATPLSCLMEVTSLASFSASVETGLGAGAGLAGSA